MLSSGSDKGWVFWGSFLPSVLPYNGYVWDCLLNTPYHLLGILPHPALDEAATFSCHFRTWPQLTCSEMDTWPKESLSWDLQIWELGSWANLSQAAKILRFETLMLVAIFLTYCSAKNKASFKEKHRWKKETCWYIWFVYGWFLEADKILLFFLQVWFSVKYVLEHSFL